MSTPSPQVKSASTFVAIRPGKKAGQVELLAFIYAKIKAGGRFVSWKFPTETSEPSETPWDTVINGVWHELLATPNLEGFNIMGHPDDCVEGEQPKPLITVRVKGDASKGGGWHDKHVFRIIITEGGESRFRKVDKMDGDDEQLGPPEYVEARELLKRMEERGVEFHIVTLLQVLSSLASDRAVYLEYRDIIEDPKYRTYLGSEGDLSHYFQQKQEAREKKQTDRLRQQSR